MEAARNKPLAAIKPGRFPTFMHIGFQRMEPSPRSRRGAVAKACFPYSGNITSCSILGRQMVSDEAENSTWKRKNPILKMARCFRQRLQFYVNVVSKGIPKDHWDLCLVVVSTSSHRRSRSIHRGLGRLMSTKLRTVPRNKTNLEDPGGSSSSMERAMDL